MTSASPSAPVVRVAILGCGAVGASLVAHLLSRADDLARQSGARIEIAGVAVADLSRSRPDDVPTALLTDAAASLVADPSIDIVVELIGGLEPAGSLIRTALESGKPVVSANKELLASPEGVALRAVASQRGVDLIYEAAVAGAIPLVRVLRESLTGERIQRVMGIVNGTTNFILTKMSDDGTEYAEVLARAQELGLAERDPTADVEGHDAAAKTAILAGVAMGYDVVTAEVPREGITRIGLVDIEFADRFGYVVKLLAVVERIGEDEISARVHPAMVPKSHPLAGVRDAFNAVFIEGEWAGELMLYGQGAGGQPTASAVVGDLIDATRNLLAGTTSLVAERRPGRLYPVADLRSAFYLTIDVEDRPGVLGLVSTVFGDHNVSIRSMEQIEEDELVGLARLIFLTHAAREGDMNETIDALAALDAVKRVGSTIRVFGDDAL